MSGSAPFNLVYAKLDKCYWKSIPEIVPELIWGIEMAGKLYIVGTPIGNLEDISDRAKRTLKEVDAVFAEDTRVSIKLLSHLGLSKTLISCHDFNEEKRLQELSKFASQNSSVALISDAGTPLISDPGYKFVRKAIELGMEILCIPGPTALIQALIGSGLPARRFSFEGFLPDKITERKDRLFELKNDERTLLFYVSVNDLKKVLEELIEIFGEREACLCRELTKLHEEYIRAGLKELLSISQLRELKGELVLVVAGNPQDKIELSEQELCLKLQVLLESGARLKDAAGILAKESGWNSSDIYKLGLKIKKAT